MFINFKEFRLEVGKLFGEYKSKAYWAMILGLVFFIISFYIGAFILGLLGVLLFFCPILLFFAKAIEESSMSKFVKINDLTVGDWLVRPLRVMVGRKIRIIEPDWEGLSEKELLLIQKNYRKKVLVKYGLPFVPAILLAFILLIWILKFIGA
jgi:hypothetical protein